MIGWWFGQPESLKRLPGVSVDYSRPAVIPGALGQTLDGRTASARIGLDPQRQWDLQFPYQVSSALLRAAHLGLLGAKPVLIDPWQVNRLSADASLCGARFGRLGEWSITGGTLAVSTAAPPTAVSALGGSAMRWTAGSASLYLGTHPANYFPALLPVIPLAGTAFSVWLKAASSTTVTLSLRKVPTAGASDPTTTQVTSSASVTTSWQRFSLTQANWDQDGQLMPALVHSGTSVAIDIAGPSVSYGTSIPDWEVGQGTPQVAVPLELGDTVGGTGRSTITMSFKQA